MYGIARGVEFATSYARSIWKAPCPARSHGPDSSCCSGFGDVKCRPNCGRCWNSMNEFRLETDVSATRSTRWHSRAALVVTVNTSIGALTPRCVLYSPSPIYVRYWRAVRSWLLRSDEPDRPGPVLRSASSANSRYRSPVSVRYEIGRAHV